MWPGGTAYIIGGGPSLAGQDLCLEPRDDLYYQKRYGLEAYLYDKHCIACNDSIYLGMGWIEIAWFCDYEWANKHMEFLLLFSGRMGSLGHGIVAHAAKLNTPQFRKMKRGKEFGIDTRPGTVSWNNSAGNAAINLAWHLGAKRVVLLGFDAGESVVRGVRETNWYPRKGKQHRSTWDRFLKAYPYIKDDAEELGLEILNATPGSRIREFPFVRLEEVA